MLHYACSELINKEIFKCQLKYLIILEKFISHLNSDEFSEVAKRSDTSFTRKRKLTLPTMIVAMLSVFKASVQNELDAFFAQMGQSTALLRTVSAQAFSKARQNLAWTAFTRLNDYLLELIFEFIEIPRWNGLRVVAADASKMQLFMKGAAKRRTMEVSAFALFMPGCEMTLKSRLYDPEVGERQMLFEHLDDLSSDDLLVLDRGYPAVWLFASLQQRGIPFCMRMDSLNFKEVVKFKHSGLAEQIVTLQAPNASDCAIYECACQPVTIRLLRIITPNGRIRILVTSLLDVNRYPHADFLSLYHSRWRIEEAFKRLKHRLALENTSGLSWNCARQDFDAKILADNLHSLTVIEAYSQIEVPENYKLNRTYVFAALKRTLPRWLLNGLPQADEVLQLLQNISKNLIRYVANASKPRKPRLKPHLYHAYKATA